MGRQQSVFSLPSEVERLQGRINEIEQDTLVQYAEKDLFKLEDQGKVIKDKPKEIAKLVGMKNRAERQAHLDYIRLNYAEDKRRAERGAESAWLESIKMPDAAELLRYGEDHNIDISTDAGIKQAVLAMAREQTAV